MMRPSSPRFQVSWLLVSVSLGVAALAAASPTTASVQQIETSGDSVRIDFQDTDIRAVISALAELMNANVSYGELPARKVTLRTPNAVPRDSLRPILDAVLRANGLEIREDASVLRIVPASEARSAAPARAKTAEPAGDLNLYVIRLKHAHAAEVAAVINALFGGAAPDPGARSSTRRSALSGQLRQGLVPPGLPTETDQPAARRAPGARAPTQGDDRQGEDRQEGRPAELESEVTIVPDIATNSLLIRATPADFRVLQQAVEHLDVRPLQVMIEVFIAEVRRNALTQLGLQLLVPTQEADDLEVEAELRERTLGNLVIRIMQLDGAGIDALFEALSASSDVRIVSRPVLVTANNQEAHILVGSERPFIQVARALPTDAGVRDQIVQFRDVGTKLTVLPTINTDGYVSLSVLQEVSAATAETQFGAPVISTREASTQLLVKDGQTVVIGGLIDRQRERVRSGVPILKDLPILGALFGSTTWRTTNTELFLFLTPHVLATDADVEEAREAAETAAPALDEDRRVPLMQRDSVGTDSTSSSRR